MAQNQIAQKYKKIEKKKEEAKKRAAFFLLIGKSVAKISIQQHKKALFALLIDLDFLLFLAKQMEITLLKLSCTFCRFFRRSPGRKNRQKFPCLLHRRGYRRIGKTYGLRRVFSMKCTWQNPLVCTKLILFMYIGKSLIRRRR